MSDNAGFDPDHTYKTDKEKEADEIWEKLKYIPTSPHEWDALTQQIIESLNRINRASKRLKDSYEKTGNSFDKMDTHMQKLQKILRKMDNENEKK